MSETERESLFSRALGEYAGIISDHPVKMLTAVVIVSVLLAGHSSNVETVEQQTEDFLPDSEPVIDAFNILDAEFSTGGSTSYTILIQTDPDHANSTEIRDVREPRFLRYIETVTNELEAFERIDSVDSPSNLFKRIPSSRSDAKESLEALGEERWSSTISKDFQAVRITFETSDLSESQQLKLADEVRQSIESQPESADFQISYSGQVYIDQAFQNQSQETMNLTSIASLFGVMLMVIILFRSIYYGLNSLLTVVFGIAIGFGVYGLLGYNITPQTSGAISLGIGIAIDFGIQPIARYREEREEMDIHDSLEETIKGVITPMTVGLAAANIGFLALAVGKLTFLADLGYLLALTTTFAYVSAFTVIPPAIVIYDRYFTVDGTAGFTLSKIKS